MSQKKDKCLFNNAWLSDSRFFRMVMEVKV